MKWFFTPPAHDDPPPAHGDPPPGHGEDDAPGLLGVPAAVLQRHGARVLDPAKAVRVGDAPPPRPTVYRAATLLVPEYALLDGELRQILDEVLAGLGLRLIPPEPDRGDARRGPAELALPRVAVLAPLPRHPVPVAVDAWAALQALRADAAARKRPEGYSEAVAQISLEHLLVGSAITGSPATEGGGGVAGGPGSSGAVSGPAVTGSYLFSGADSRLPVAVLADPPARRDAGTCQADYGRRAVVAVLDTGLRAQPLLDVVPDGSGGYAMPADGFTATDDAIQAAICAEGLHARNAGDPSRQVIWDARDRPAAASRLVGELNPAERHSTFIAGIVRQVTPDAQVLALRVLHSDDVAYEGDIICALRHLIRRIELAQAGGPAGMVDVVSLSFGYFGESPHDGALTSGLGKVIRRLLELGVVVVAAAGNYATTRRFYPAAFAGEAVPAGQVPVFGVGALNPDGTKAMFSNDGPWVTAWARGACVVSTYPVDVDGGRAPELRVPADRKPRGILPPGREALDPDDFSGGWAVWSGTSFAAPYLAGLVARALMEGAAGPGGLKLTGLGPQAAAGRAAAAVAALHEEEAQLPQKETPPTGWHG